MTLNTKLDAEVAALFAAMAPPEGAAPATRPTAQQARALHQQIGRAMAQYLRPIAQVRDLQIPGPEAAIKVRLYRPAEGESLPLFIFLHGGGWIGGDLDTHELLCRDFAEGAQCAVVAIDYRLAPEHKFPAAVQDCVAATAYILDHAAEFGADPVRIAIGGDSAGGNLAAVVVQQLKYRAGPHLMFQLLAYPATDFRMLTPSFEELALAPGLSTQDFVWCRGQYLVDTRDIEDPRASPILTPDLSGSPPTLVITAGLDPLRDDGELYGAKLIAAGTDVRMRRYLGLPHSFLSLPPTIRRRKQAMSEVCEVLRRAFETLNGSLVARAGAPS